MAGCCGHCTDVMRLDGESGRGTVPDGLEVLPGDLASGLKGVANCWPNEMLISCKPFSPHQKRARSDPSFTHTHCRY